VTDLIRYLKYLPVVASVITPIFPFFPFSKELKQVIGPPSLEGDMAVANFVYLITCAFIVIGTYAFRYERNLSFGSALLLLVAGISTLLLYWYLTAPGRALMQYGVDFTVARQFNFPSPLFLVILYDGIFIFFTWAFAEIYVKIAK
jgi:hypothetical protein